MIKFIGDDFDERENYNPKLIPGRCDEYILCAAIWFDDGKVYPNQPKNIPSGIVLCGWRHGSIFPQIGGLVKERKDLGINEKEQGFITSKNRFVDRTEAMKIAIVTEQVSKDLKDKELYSENLY